MLNSILKPILLLVLFTTPITSYLFEQSVQELFKDIVSEEELASFTPYNPLLQNMQKGLLVEKDITEDVNFGNLPFLAVVEDSEDLLSVGTSSEDVAYILDIWKPNTASFEIDETAKLPALTWENRFNILRRVPECLQTNAIDQLFEALDILLFNPITFTKTVKITLVDVEEEYCAEMRSMYEDLVTYLQQIKSVEQFNVFVTLIYDSVDLLSIFEALNIITGDLSLENIAVSIDEEGVPGVMIERIHKMKFVTFTQQDEDTVLRYHGIYTPPEIKARTVTEEKDQETVNIINQYGWDYRGYTYTLKEDNYAFGMMLQAVSSAIQQITDDIETKVAFENILNELIPKLTAENPMERISFKEAADIFAASFEFGESMYKIFTDENQGLVNDEKKIRDDAYAAMNNRLIRRVI